MAYRTSYKFDHQSRGVETKCSRGRAKSEQGEKTKTESLIMASAQMTVTCLYRQIHPVEPLSHSLPL
jgi:hypothetical protein